MFRLPLRIQIAALAIAAFVLAALSWRQKAVFDALARAEAKRKEDRLRAVLQSEEIENEVEGLSADALREHAGKWVQRGRER